MTITAETQSPAVDTQSPVDLPAGTVARFHVTPAALERALKIAVLAASTDQTLPVLNSVALTWTGAHMAAVSTDRYRIVFALVETITADKSGPLPHVVEELETPALLPVAEVKTLLGWIKPLVKSLDGWGNLTVSVQREGHHPGRVVLETPLGTSYTVNLADGQYPRLYSFFTGEDADEGAGRYALNPAYLESVAKMAKIGCEKNTPVEILAGATANKPVHFRGWGVDGLLTFHGLLMPVRLPDVPGHRDTSRI